MAPGNNKKKTARMSSDRTAVIASSSSNGSKITNKDGFMNGPSSGSAGMSGTGSKEGDHDKENTSSNVRGALKVSGEELESVTAVSSSNVGNVKSNLNKSSSENGRTRANVPFVNDKKQKEADIVQTKQQQQQQQNFNGTRSNRWDFSAHDAAAAAAATTNEIASMRRELSSIKEKRFALLRDYQALSRDLRQSREELQESKETIRELELVLKQVCIGGGVAIIGIISFEIARYYALVHR